MVRFSDRGKRLISSPELPDRLWGPPSLLLRWYLGYFSGVKWPGHKVHHSPHSSTSSTLVVICVVQLLFVLFYVLFVCKCVLPPGDNQIAVNEYIKYLVPRLRISGAKPPPYDKTSSRAQGLFHYQACYFTGT